MITHQTWNAVAVVLATEILWGDSEEISWKTIKKKKIRIEQQEIELNDENPMYYTEAIKAIMRKVELTRQTLGITIQ